MCPDKAEQHSELTKQMLFRSSFEVVKTWPLHCNAQTNTWTAVFSASLSVGSSSLLFEGSTFLHTRRVAKTEKPTGCWHVTVYHLLPPLPHQPTYDGCFQTFASTTASFLQMLQEISKLWRK